MPLQDEGKKAVLNGLKSAATQVRVLIEQEPVSQGDPPTFTQSDPLPVTWGDPAKVSGQEVWRITASNAPSLVWNINPVLSNHIVYAVEVLNSSNVSLGAKTLDTPELFDREGEFDLELLIISTQ